MRMFTGSALLCLLLYQLNGGVLPQIVCKTFCNDGQFCEENTCKGCPERTYRDIVMHRETYCKPWTTKPPQSHYVKTKNGTAKSDNVWECSAGYVEQKYTESSSECVLIEATTPTTIEGVYTTNETTPLPEIETTTETPPQSKESANNSSLGVNVGVSVGVICVVVIIICVVFFYLKRRRDSRSRDQPDNPRDSENELLLLRYDKFCHDIINSLGTSLSLKFLRSLDDPSGKFDADAVIAVTSREIRDSTEYLTRSLVRWVTDNHGIHRTCLEACLRFVGRPRLLNKLKPPEDIFVRFAGVNSSGDGTTAQNRLNSPERYRLFYYLETHLGGNAKQLINMLPEVVNGFIAREYIQTCEKLDGFDNNFAETLNQWWLRDPTNALTKIKSNLEKTGRMDIVNDITFKKMCAKEICPIIGFENV